MSFFGKSSGGEPRITFEHIDLAAETRSAALRAVATPTPKTEAATPGPMLLSADSEVEGELRSRGAVRVEGVLRGGLQAPLLMLEIGGQVDGTVKADRVRIAGTLRGTVIAREIEVARTACVEAELVYDEISIERGARVRGLHRQRDPETPSAQATGSDNVTEAVSTKADAPVDESILLAAAASTAALVAEAEAALQELAQVSQAAAGAAAELAQDGVDELVDLEVELRATPERLLNVVPTL
ncbi:bactofilin family protein [Teichococcus vastitatis]|uniref:bactofilin family protein n=1 Tax=Teichococcus vastitatis TaxID=2307076 RepID=UPI000E70B2E3|nr:polymer-forming cytoskeletal protein [Pseudoroseomonas vastitatis]